MATVFKAYQASLDRFVAIKVLPVTGSEDDPEFLKRFQREARAIAQLNHPNILAVYDFGVDRDYSFIVMRYIESGQTLNRLLNQSLSQGRMIELINLIGQGLAYAHKNDIVHRDLKPGNILIDDNGWPLLSDFGLAKVSQASTKLTKSGTSMGTPAYMSPEQAKGETVDAKTDIYALGVVLYQMLTGAIPHDADTPWAIATKRITEPPIPPRTINPTVPQHIEHALLRSLALNPQERYDSVIDFLAALQDEPTIPSRQLQPLHSTCTSKRHLSLKWAMLFTFIAIVIIGGGWFWRISSASLSKPTPTQPQPVVVVEVPTVTETPTLTPSSTSTSTPIPPTNTNTPIPTLTPTPSTTNTSVPPTNTHTPIPTSTPTILLPTATLTATPTPIIPTGNFTPLNPVNVDDPSYGLTEFEWEWTGHLTPEFGFEIRVWHDGENPMGVHDAVLDNKEGRTENISENKYRLNVDITNAAGVKQRGGEYLWTVALIRISPEYEYIGPVSDPVRFRFEPPGKEDSGGGNDSSSNNGGQPVGGID